MTKGFNATTTTKQTYMANKRGYETLTIEVPPSLNRRFAKVCIDKGCYKKDVLLKFIEEYVKKNE